MAAAATTALKRAVMSRGTCGLGASSICSPQVGSVCPCCLVQTGDLGLVCEMWPSVLAVAGSKDGHLSCDRAGAEVIWLTWYGLATRVLE